MKVIEYQGLLRINGACLKGNGIRNNPRPVGQRWTYKPGVKLVTIRLVALKSGVLALSGLVKALTDADAMATIGAEITESGRQFVAGDFSHGKTRRFVPGLPLIRTNTARSRYAQTLFQPLFVPGDIDFGSRIPLIAGQAGRGRSDASDVSFVGAWDIYNSACNDRGAVKLEDLFTKKCCYEVETKNAGGAASTTYSGAVCPSSKVQSQAATGMLRASRFKGWTCIARFIVTDQSPGTPCCYNNARKVQGAAECPATLTDGYNLVRADTYMEVAKVASGAGFTSYWGEPKADGKELWEHLSDLNYDGKVSIDDKVYTQEASVGISVFVQAPPDQAKPNAIRGSPVVFGAPSQPECKLSMKTSIFLPTGTNEHDLVINGGNLQSLIQIFAVFADDSADFQSRLREMEDGESKVYFSAGVGALVSMHAVENAVVRVGDANGVASGVYVPFEAHVHANFATGDAHSEIAVSLAFAKRQKESSKAKVVYLPPVAKHARPLVENGHLGPGWSRKRLCTQSQESRCIHDPNEGTDEFPLPDGIRFSKDCWEGCAEHEITVQNASINAPPVCATVTTTTGTATTTSISTTTATVSTTTTTTATRTTTSGTSTTQSTTTSTRTSTTTSTYTATSSTVSSTTETTTTSTTSTTNTSIMAALESANDDDQMFTMIVLEEFCFSELCTLYI
jgi:hypothetical protein